MLESTQQSVLSRLKAYSDLKYLVFSYLLLVVTDTAHHIHAAFALGQMSALHSVVIGMVLAPMAIFSIYIYLQKGKCLYYWCFYLIALLATLLPGLYHGGWHHLFKIIPLVKVKGAETELAVLFPKDNFHLWFYEVTGVFEFILGVVLVYFLGKTILNHAGQHNHLMTKISEG